MIGLLRGILGVESIALISPLILKALASERHSI